MTEENSSHGSEYYDFTPSKQQTYTEGDEELDWDEYEEALSVVDHDETAETVRNSAPGPRGGDIQPGRHREGQQGAANDEELGD